MAVNTNTVMFVPFEDPSIPVSLPYHESPVTPTPGGTPPWMPPVKPVIPIPWLPPRVPAPKPVPPIISGVGIHQGGTIMAVAPTVSSGSNLIANAPVMVMTGSEHNNGSLGPAPVEAPFIQQVNPPGSDPGTSTAAAPASTAPTFMVIVLAVGVIWALKHFKVI